LALLSHSLNSGRLAVCSAVQAQHAGAALAANGFKLFGALVKCAGAEKAAADGKLKATVFAPTDLVSPMHCIAHCRPNDVYVWAV
jgi:hypothetical protein